MTATPQGSSDGSAGGEATSTGLPPRVAAVLACSAWWGSGLLMSWAEPRHRFVRFHARQSVLVFGAVWVFGVATWILSVALAFVSPVAFRVATALSDAVWGCGLAWWVACLVQAARGREWTAPWTGRLTARSSCADPGDGTDRDRRTVA